VFFVSGRRLFVKVRKENDHPVFYKPLSPGNLGVFSTFLPLLQISPGDKKHGRKAKKAKKR
jgi:hypothetical protein